MGRPASKFKSLDFADADTVYLTPTDRPTALPISLRGLFLRFGVVGTPVESSESSCPETSTMNESRSKPSNQATVERRAAELRMSPDGEIRLSGIDPDWRSVVFLAVLSAVRYLRSDTQAIDETGTAIRLHECGKERDVAGNCLVCGNYVEPR